VVSKSLESELEELELSELELSELSAVVSLCNNLRLILVSMTPF
jgi:hypothetical protein